MRLLLWLSGEHPSMPAAEAVAAFEAEGRPLGIVAERRRFLVADAEGDEAALTPILLRLGLLHEASEALFDVAWEPSALRGAVAEVALAPSTRFAVRAERLGAAGPMRTKVERELGALLAVGRRVDLARPDALVRAFIDDGHVWVGRRIWDRDPKETAQRHVKHRPKGSPVSLPPKTARALLNLARVPRGGLVYDPFCGTGGVLLEAASMGFRTAGSDLDPDMVEASAENLRHYRLPSGVLFASDVGDAPRALRKHGVPPPDAVVSDLPYGRSSSTGREPIMELYERAFAAIRECLTPGRFAVLGLPSAGAARRAAEFLEPVAEFRVWVHRSLTRHFVVLRRGA